MKRTFSSFGVALWIAFTAPMATAVPNRLELIQLPPPDSASSVSYTGAKLTLNFQDIDLRAVLQQIADVAGLNLVTSDEVQGSITLRLKDVPWDQALDLVLQTKGLDKRVKAGVLLVAPADELAARELLILESRKQMAELAPLRRELLQVNYAKAADLAKLFQSVTGFEGATDERGSVAVDDRTNNIIAYQTGERLEELRRIVAQLDIPVRQVMIEARIVEANVDYDKSLGVRWGGRITRGGGGVGGIAKPQADGAEPPQNPPSSPFVDLGSLAGTSGLGIAYITDNLLLDLELTAMEKPATVKSSRNPRSSPPTKRLHASSKAPRFLTRNPPPRAPPRCRSKRLRCRWR